MELCTSGVSATLKGYEIQPYSQPLKECKLEILPLHQQCFDKFVHVQSTVHYMEGTSFSQTLVQLRSYENQPSLASPSVSSINWTILALGFLLLSGMCLVFGGTILVLNRNAKKSKAELGKIVYFTNF